MLTNEDLDQFFRDTLKTNTSHADVTNVLAHNATEGDLNIGAITTQMMAIQQQMCLSLQGIWMELVAARHERADRSSEPSGGSDSQSSDAPVTEAADDAERRRRDQPGMTYGP